MTLNIIACVSLNNAIGYNNDLLYKIPEDLSFFKTMTKNKTVIMGRKTWVSIGSKPLPNRNNIIVSREDLSLENAIKKGKTFDEDIFIIGGGELYRESLKLPYDFNVYLTYVQDIYPDKEGVVYFPNINFKEWQLMSTTPIQKSKKTEYHYQMFHYYKKYTSNDYKQKEESIYINELKTTLISGEKRETRNSITYSRFGVKMEFDLSNNKVPVLTTKKMAWKTVIKELLWFISGDTNNNTLNAQGVHIWDGNTPTGSNGDLGPIYGFQWRKWGSLQDTSNGIDQLQMCIDMIRKDPTNRRIIMSAWNPTDIPKMALPPCHIMCQWYIEDNKTLSLQLYQRSGDAFLGVPFNILSYSVLIYMVAKITGYKPGRFIHIVGDFHIYDNHTDPVMEQICREPYDFPTLEIGGKQKEIDDFTIKDFNLIDYKHYDSLKGVMVP